MLIAYTPRNKKATYTLPVDIQVGIFPDNKWSGHIALFGSFFKVSKFGEGFVYELTNKPLEHTPPVISEDSLHNHLGICSEGVLVRSWILGCISKLDRHKDRKPLRHPEVAGCPWEGPSRRCGYGIYKMMAYKSLRIQTPP